MDEAHRIRTSSNSLYTPKAKRSERAQIDELIESTKVAVFFIDDHQAVRPGEVCSTQMIREAAIRHGAKIFEQELRTQFRCAGSDKYIDWVDQLLEIRKTNTTKLGGDEFGFEIFDDPQEVDLVVQQRIADGATARLTAGFCWPWSPPDANGDLVADVKIGGFARPWNAKPDASRLAKGIPKASFWADRPPMVLHRSDACTRRRALSSTSSACCGVAIWLFEMVTGWDSRNSRGITSFALDLAQSLPTASRIRTASY